MRRRRVLPAALMAGVMWLAGCTDQPILEPGEQEVPAPSLSVQEADLIPGQYIVVFNDDVKEPVQLALQLAAAHGLTMRHTYQHTIKGFSAVVPEGRLRALEQHPMVQYVEQNSYMYIDTHERFLEIAAENQAAAAALALGLLSGPAAGGAPFRAPTNLNATAVSETEINVTWTDRNGDEAGHEVHRSNSPGGTFTQVADLGPNSTEYDDTGLDPSTQYCYKVRAYKYNKKGRIRYTDFSNTDCATTFGPPQPPAAPSNLQANAVSSSQIDLTWNDNSNDEDNFRIERCTGTVASCDDADFGFLTNVGANVTSYNDTGLPASTTFTYRVRAENAVGPSGWSNEDDATTFAPPTVPNAPSNLVATAVSSSQIDLTWTDNSNNEDNFELERCEGEGCTNFANIANPPVNSTSYNDTGLDANTVYRYRIRACNAVGCSGYSTIAEDQTPALPQPPAAPSNLVATAVSSSQIDLTWDDLGNEDKYEIERCVGAGCTDFAYIDEVGADVTSYNDMGLTPSMTYRYQVRGWNEAGYGPYSDPAEATTLEAGACDDNGVHDDLSDPGLWGIVKVKADQNALWQGVRGNGPECAMQAEFFGLDTGVDSDHPDLNVVEIHTFLTGDNSGGEDGHGHGTHTAGTAAAIDGGPAVGVVGVAPGAKIHGFKVCTDGGSCPTDAIIAGVDAVTARKNASFGTPMVANMSLGGGVSQSIDQAVRKSVAAGVVYTLSAGNGVFGFCFFPADAQNASPARVGDDDITASGGSSGDTRRVNGAITTTSSGQTDGDVNCNFGNPVTVASPGNGIKSTWLNGGYNTISGTSMAAPHSAGAVILVLQGNPGWTPTQVEQAIVNDLDNWTTNDLPNADGRLDARCLGTGSPSCQGNN